jgi:hypothetical protein
MYEQMKYPVCEAISKLVRGSIPYHTTYQSYSLHVCNALRHFDLNGGRDQAFSKSNCKMLSSSFYRDFSPETASLFGRSLAGDSVMELRGLEGSSTTRIL